MKSRARINAERFHRKHKNYSVYYMIGRRGQAIRTGFCSECFVNHASKERKLCKKCLAKAAAYRLGKERIAREYHHDWYEHLKRIGVCVNCGIKKSIPCHVHCRKCLEIMRVRRRNYVWRMKNDTSTIEDKC